MSSRVTLEPDVMSELVNGYFRDLDLRPWNRFETIEWDRLGSGSLSDDHRSAVSFITFIEDHLPGYFLEYQRLFPVDGSCPPEDFVHNRELYHFTVKWAQEEDSHAHTLALYQLRSGMASPAELRSTLAEEGRKAFRLEFEQPVQIFAYTLIQEKATQLFYQQFSRATAEPVLQQILGCLARDEARHFAFFSRVMRAYLTRFGEGLLPAVKDVLQRFKMPLADTLRGYWRWSLRISEAVGGYDHSLAYGDLIRVIRSCADARSWSKTQDLASLIDAIHATSS